MEANKQIKYFPGLNALRFIAATLVIFHHIEQYKHWIGIESAWGIPIIDSLGHKSVSFFFVLSGFLITYLLMSENHRNGDVNLRWFYMRRLLRIWPLYFVIVGVALLFLPVITGQIFEQDSFGVSVWVSLLLFVPNLLRIFRPTIVGANQLWSVGIEEQFYLIWPVLIRTFANKIFSFLIAFILIKLAVHGILILTIESMNLTEIHFRILQVERLYALFPVEQMAIGGIGAALIFYGREGVLNIIYSKATFVVSFILTSLFAFIGFHQFWFTYVEAVLFLVLIMNVCHHQWINRPLEWKPFQNLGNISYGIYMWHTSVIAIIMTLLVRMNIDLSLIDWILYPVVTLMTLAISHISYTYFEKPFLKLKNTFDFKRSKIKMGVMR